MGRWCLHHQRDGKHTAGVQKEGNLLKAKVVQVGTKEKERWQLQNSDRQEKTGRKGTYSCQKAGNREGQAGWRKGA